MRTKDIVGRIILIIAVLLLIVGCDDDDDILIESTGLYAVWAPTSATVDGVVQDNLPEYFEWDETGADRVTMELFDDSTILINYYVSDSVVEYEGGTAVIQGSEIVLTATSENGVPGDSDLILDGTWEVSGSTLAFRFTESDEEHVQVWTKME